MVADLTTLAAEANGFLKREKRGDRAILLPVDDAPQWFTDLCHHAHGEMLPDDWKYEFIQDALRALEESADEDDAPDLDSVYPYTADRLRWLASNLNRTAYCDEAAEDYGQTFSAVLPLIALGMQQEMNEVYRLVREKLEELAAERDAAGPGDETEAAG